ncbi:MAG: ThiF family adenylyltransferase [Erythrobacter sp.]
MLPRATLDALIVRALSEGGRSQASDAAPWLAHAPLTFQPIPDGLAVLPGLFRAGPVVRGDDARTPPADGVVVLAIAGPGHRPPSGGIAWEAWMREHAPGFRLGTSAVNPALAVIWLRTDGAVAAGCRRTDWTAGAAWDEAAWLPPSRWRAFDAISLPGAAMIHLRLGPEHAPPSGTRQAIAYDRPSHNAHPPAVEADESGSRYSRLAGALGAAVLERMQHSRIAVIGLGRTGSTLAHSLARMGVSLQLFDPDLIEPHNLDGDLPPLLEGRSKAEGVQRFVRGLLRPGAQIDARVLAVASPVAGPLLAACDVIVSCVDNDAARLRASVWALALHKPHLDIATGLHAHGAEADLRLLPPGTGCLVCLGGLAQAEQLAAQWASAAPPPTPADFRLQRAGSLQSWGVLSAHAGLRMLEAMYAGRIGHALFRRLAETEEGGLAVRDTVSAAVAEGGCGFCDSLSGRGTRGVDEKRLASIVNKLTHGRTTGSASLAGRARS